MSKLEFERWELGPLDSRIHRHGITADGAWDEVIVDAKSREAHAIVRAELARLGIANATAHDSLIGLQYWVQFVLDDERRLERCKNCDLECIVWLRKRRREFRFKGQSLGTEERLPAYCSAELNEAWLAD